MLSTSVTFPVFAPNSSLNVLEHNVVKTQKKFQNLIFLDQNPFEQHRRDEERHEKLFDHPFFIENILFLKK